MYRRAKSEVPSCLLRKRDLTIDRSDGKKALLMLKQGLTKAGIYLSKQRSVLESGVFFENVCDSNNLQEYFIDTDTLEPARMVPQVWVRMVRRFNKRMKAARRVKSTLPPPPPDVTWDSSSEDSQGE
ncbi:hypothetical protein Pcinc_021109 [Petrolisthes cinctipes]|uniref:Uncharacterized protein n=1 Tax=Petrolisthes cinctipes TaxID=88211 RepID=A0AAE1FGR2_PETCI|nr:hypothetical protein Pcinc_021109 [Petrolisthes cinctipes]